MAFDMISIINSYKQKIGFTSLNMRIGIHTVCLFKGKVIGGIVGTDIVRYDIYG